MEGKFINFISISEKDGVHNYIISYRMLLSYVFLLLFVFLLIVFSSAYINYSLKSSKNDYNFLIQFLQKEIKRMKNDVEIIRKYIKEINLIFEDDLVYSPDEKDKKYGTGGGKEQLYSSEIEYKLDEKIQPNALKLKLDLLEKIDNLGEDLNNLSQKK